MDPKIQKFDVAQSAPSVRLPASEEFAGPVPHSFEPTQLFGPGQANQKAYSQIALWAKSFHPPRPEPLQLSVSAIDTYERCPMKYMFQYVWGLRGAAHAQMTFGNVMHTTIKELVSEIQKRRTITFDEVLATYEREWSAAGFTDDYHEQQYRRAGRDQLQAFYNTYSAAPANVLHQEKRFELPLEHEIVVTGRIDQINQIDRDGIEIVDYKTGRPRDEKKASEDLQLSVYAIAAQEVLGIDPTRLVFYNLTTNEAIPASRDAKTLAATKQRIASVADQIRAGDFSARPGFACSHCDYKPACPAHEQLVNIQSLKIQPAGPPGALKQ